MWLELSEFLDIIKSAGVIIASVVAIWGINSWRREAKWKRKYELAEEVLASFYEAHQAIQIIRSPFGYGNEGSSRPKNEKETEQESHIYDKAFVSRERFERNKTSFDKLKSLKFRFIAIHGKEYEKYFDEFTQTVNRIFWASDQIAMVRLGYFGDDKHYIRETIVEARKILYSKSNKEDKIETDLKVAIKEMKKKCKEIIGKNS